MEFQIKEIINELLNDVESQERQRNAKRRFSECFSEMYNICKDMGWGDPFSYARSREIHMANMLGHMVAPTLSGADAIDEDGNECEYKSTIAKEIGATYNGISVQDSWEQQEEYLVKNKIGKYNNHYYARYDGPDIVEMYVMTKEKVLEFMLPKLKVKFLKEKKGKDPRLGISIPKKYIIEHAKRLK